MKLSNSEIMKKLDLLYDEKAELTSNESNNNHITYATAVDKKIALDGNDYNYKNVTKRIAEIDSEVIMLKGKLAVANATVIVPGYNLTIGQCLVKLGQINEGIRRYDRLRSTKQTYSTVYNTGSISYTEYLHDVNDAKKKYNELCNEKAALQVAIDKINLLNEIEL